MRPCPSDPTATLDTAWLGCCTQQIIEGSRLAILPSSPLNVGLNATWVWTPDASESYGAQWTRDFAYAVSYAPELFANATDVKRAVRYSFRGQRADGCMPDRVQADGQSVMSPGRMLPGNKPNPEHNHAWDNGPFAALLLAAASVAWPDRAFFCELEPHARHALDFVNRTVPGDGLVFNSLDSPNCTYGFTDTVAKTGSLLFTSLLYIDASRRLADLATTYQCGDADRYASEAAQLSGSVDGALWKRHGASPSLWSAASHNNALPDVWGSAYLVALNLSTPERREEAMAELEAHHALYFASGQVHPTRHPTPSTLALILATNLALILALVLALTLTPFGLRAGPFAAGKPLVEPLLGCGLPAAGHVPEWSLLGHTAALRRPSYAPDGTRALCDGTRACMHRGFQGQLEPCKATTEILACPPCHGRCLTFFFFCPFL